MNKRIEDVILKETNSKCIVKSELIQTLWSGYGALNRITTDKTSIILKLITLPNSPHPRKVRSYQVENNFYKSYKSHQDNAYTPIYIASSDSNDNSYLILEDLETKGFSPQKSITKKEVRLCLKWLASFHKQYLNYKVDDLWSIGTYWHLNTRLDEYKVMKDLKLKGCAILIDSKLTNAKYKTIVHGDAKLANFLFSESSVAAVDFQYAGSGVGVKDIAYFLSSVYNTEELFRNENDCLDYYFKELNNTQVENEWRELYPFAWADFYRFLNGWSSDHYKVNAYSEHMRDLVVKCF
jgi:thiamine kinase-like enzyme